jgi:hypothetical protein
MRNILLILFSLISISAFSQERVYLDLSKQTVLKLASEVYNEDTQYLTPAHLSGYTDFLNRIEIIKVSDEYLVAGHYKLISTLDLMSKYNPDLDYDKGPNYDINTFNPLKYFWVTEKDGSSDYYGIYQTNYLIRLLPKN